MDRFRSMPIARSAVPFGRTAADLLGAAVGVAIMALIALLVAGGPTTASPPRWGRSAWSCCCATR